MAQNPVSDAWESFGATAVKVVLWLVAAGVVIGLMGFTDDGDAEQSSVLGEARAAAIESPKLDPLGPEAENAETFLQNYYNSLLDSSTRRSALNGNLTPAFRESVDFATVDAFWSDQQTTSVSEVVPVSPTRFEAIVTHVPYDSHAVPQHMEFELICEVPLENGTVCPAEEFLIADARHHKNDRNGDHTHDGVHAH